MVRLGCACEKEWVVFVATCSVTLTLLAHNFPFALLSQIDT